MRLATVSCCMAVLHAQMQDPDDLVQDEHPAVQMAQDFGMFHFHHCGCWLDTE